MNNVEQKADVFEGFRFSSSALLVTLSILICRIIFRIFQTESVHPEAGGKRCIKHSVHDCAHMVQHMEIEFR